MKLKKLALAMLAIYSRTTGLSLGALALKVDKIESIADAETRKLYKQKGDVWVLDVDGIPEPTDTTKLEGAIKKEREAREAAERKAKELTDLYKDIDPEQVRKIMAQFDDADEAKLVAQGREGIEKLIAKRTDKLVKAMEKKVADAQAQADAQAKVAKTYQDRVLDNHVRAAVSKAGMHTSAVDDALLRARTIFSLDNEGNAVQLKDNEIVLGKDGKTPFKVDEWVEGMKETAPHWFPASAGGGGSGGAGGGKPGQKTMKRSAFDALSVDAQRQAVTVDKVQVVD